MTDIQLFQILKQKLGEKEAEALVQFVDTKLKESNEQNLKVLATKQDIAESKAEIIKWMFVFIMGLLISISGIMIAILHAYLK